MVNLALLFGAGAAGVVIAGEFQPGQPEAALGAIPVLLSSIIPAIPGALLGTYVAMILWLGGMKYGTASRAALLNQSATIFVLVLSRIAGEVVPARRWLGAAIAVGGVLAVLLL